MSPVNKRTKVLRYESNPHSGYIDPHNQQTKPIESNRISAAEGQEPLGLIFGTLSPPESETEGYIDHTHSKSTSTRGYAESAPTPTRYNNEGNRFSYSNTKQILS
ncbi:hypothetical protein K7432_009239 [Basidiobolus ranarum]|uniref:Uncharacterized protein n=1 Tax=Basidiobolus ranarum TaxID=34480 RepID=A0ABR2WQL6_9FUNG